MKSDLKALLKDGVIDAATAERIEQWYEVKAEQKPNRILTIFAVVGALLVGLGVILMIAHNWDQFSRTTKTVFSLLPLAIGQAVVLYSFLKKKDSEAWTESSSIFLVLSIGATISLISQVYNLGGTISAFLLSWLLLALPIIYLMNSFSSSFLYLIGITVFGFNSRFDGGIISSPVVYWLLLAGILPYYFYLCKNKPNQNATFTHHWLLALSLAFSFLVGQHIREEWWVFLYMGLFSFFYALGSTSFFSMRSMKQNSWLVIGSLGIIGLCFLLSFQDFWNEIREDLVRQEAQNIKAVIALSCFYFLTVLVLVYKRMEIDFKNRPLLFIWIPFLIFYFVPVPILFSKLLFNLLILAIAIWYIISGVQKNSLGYLNFGLVIISILVACRFFDTEMSFVVRGIIFMLIGSCFFAANYFMVKKRKRHEVS